MLLLIVNVSVAPKPKASMLMPPPEPPARVAAEGAIVDFQRLAAVRTCAMDGAALIATRVSAEDAVANRDRCGASGTHVKNRTTTAAAVYRRIVIEDAVIDR